MKLLVFFMTIRLPIIFIVLLALLLVVGAIFLGLFSCGGYIWHRQVIYLLIALFVVLCMLKPPLALQASYKRGLIPIFSLVLFLLVRASASAFYPSAPDSIVSFFKSFWVGIVYGPC